MAPNMHGGLGFKPTGPVLNRRPERESGSFMAVAAQVKRQLRRVQALAVDQRRLGDVARGSAAAEGRRKRGVRARDAAWQTMQAHATRPGRTPEAGREIPPPGAMGMWAGKLPGGGQGENGAAGAYQEEFQTQLSVRTQWTKSVAARLQAESSAAMARLRREEAAAEARVSALAARLLAPGQTMRVQGRLLGQETESAAAARRGAKASLAEQGFLLRREQRARQDLRLGGRQSTDLVMQSPTNRDLIMQLQGRSSAPPEISVGAVGAARAAAKTWREKAAESAEARGESLGAAVSHAVMLPSSGCRCVCGRRHHGSTACLAVLPATRAGDAGWLLRGIATI
jgi:hypothetical protein